MSLSDDIRKSKIKAKLCMDSIVTSISKSLETQLKNKFDVKAELLDFKTEKGQVTSELAGKKIFDKEKDMKKASDDIKDYIESIDQDTITEMVKEYGDL